MADLEAQLAERIIEARLSRRPLRADDPPWGDLTEVQADRVAELIYTRWGSLDSPFWKLGAVDGATQRRLGLDGPVSAPLVPTRVHVDTAHVAVDLRDFVDGKFEAELGVEVGLDMRFMPCVEIADSAFEGWRLPPFGVVADACLQSTMIFGQPCAPVETVYVQVTHDGRLVASEKASWLAAVDRLAVLPPGCPATHVATGAVTVLIPVERGEWTFDFGLHGQVVIQVR